MAGRSCAIDAPPTPQPPFPVWSSPRRFSTTRGNVMRHPIRVIAVAAAAVALAVSAGGLISAAEPTANNLPAEKQALEDAAASFRATAPKGDKAHDPGRPLDAQTDGPPDTGLLGAFNAPISGSEFTPTN